MTSIAVGPFPSGVAVAERAVWVVTSAGVARIDPTTNRVVARVRVGSVGGEGPCGIAAGAGGVWVSRGFPGQVLRIDADTRRVTARLLVPGAGCLAVGRDSVWGAASPLKSPVATEAGKSSTARLVGASKVSRPAGRRGGSIPAPTA